MRKYSFILFSALIILIFSFNVNAKSATFSIGNKYLSTSFNSNHNFIFGVGIGFTADDIPSYVNFDDSPYSWWEERGTKNKENEIELFVGKSFSNSYAININLAVGLAMQEKVDLYWSTATYWYWGKERTNYSPTFHGSIEYILSNKYKINLGYHNLHGLIGGIGFNF